MIKNQVNNKQNIIYLPKYITELQWLYNIITICTNGYPDIEIEFLFEIIDERIKKNKFGEEILNKVKNNIFNFMYNYTDVGLESVMCVCIEITFEYSELLMAKAISFHNS